MRQLKSLLPFLFIFILMLETTRLKAQQPLSLGDAIDLCLQENFDVRIERKRSALAVNNNTWGNAGMLPQLNLIANQQNGFNDQDNPASFINGKFQTQSINYGAEATWTLFNGLRVYTNKDRLEALETQSKGNIQLVVQNALQATILAYQQVLLEEERLRVLKQVKNLSRDEYHYQQDKKELGAAGTFDVLQVKNAYLTDSANFVNQELTARNAARQLNLSMGLPSDTAFLLIDSLEAPVYPYAYSALKAKTLENNQNLLNQFMNQRIRQYDVELARKERYPQLNFQSGIQQTQNRLTFERTLDGGGTSNQSNTGSTFNYYFNFSLNYNLFDGGRVQRSIENARIEQEIEQLTTKQLQQEVLNELRTALENYQTRIKLYNINSINVKSAQTNLGLSKEKFNNGSISSFDFRTVQNQYLQAATDQLQSLYNLIESHTELLRITGGIVAQNTP